MMSIMMKIQDTGKYLITASDGMRQVSVSWRMSETDAYTSMYDRQGDTI